MNSLMLIIEAILLLLAGLVTYLGLVFLTGFLYNLGKLKATMVHIALMSAKYNKERSRAET